MSKERLLIVDRDGTIIREPADEQIDSLEKLEFVHGAISGLKAVSTLGYRLVMCTNQDGLGTDSFPEDTFWPAHNRMLSTLEGEGVKFDEFLIDRHFPEDNAPTRKPGIGMFTEHMEDDLASSIVIGDRVSDVMLAHNLGAKAVLLAPKEAGERMLSGQECAASCALITDDWSEIAEFFRFGTRTALVERHTSETDIRIFVDLDGRSESHISTGVGFFDHMLDQLVHHGGISLQVDVKGDLHVDEHHTVEDTAIALGTAITKALGDKKGICRYGFVLPMDECDAMVLMDLGGRIDFKWDVRFRREKIGDMPTEMFEHFFGSLASALRCNLHISASRKGNEHHKIEGVFKAFARTLRAAVDHNTFSFSIPSSKGIL